MGRTDRRRQARLAHTNPPTRKMAPANRRVLLVLGALALALALATYFAMNSGSM